MSTDRRSIVARNLCAFLIAPLSVPRSLAARTKAVRVVDRTLCPLSPSAHPTRGRIVALDDDLDRVGYEVSIVTSLDDGVADQ